jgi:hypothetical protein
MIITYAHILRMLLKYYHRLICTNIACEIPVHTEVAGLSTTNLALQFRRSSHRNIRQLLYNLTYVVVGCAGDSRLDLGAGEGWGILNSAFGDSLREDSKV